MALTQNPYAHWGEVIHFPGLRAGDQSIFLNCQMRNGCEDWGILSMVQLKSHRCSSRVVVVCSATRLN